MQHDDINNELDINEQIAIRREKLAAMRKQGNAYPNDFHRDSFAADLHLHYDAMNAEALEQIHKSVKIAGRIMTRRVMGKASFIHIQDQSGRMQLYLKSDDLPTDVYELFKTWDLGDIVGAEGTLFKTKTGELSIKVKNIRLIVKALLPLPDKFHGLTDLEMRYRQRYLDLMTNESSRKIFLIRSKIVAGIRQYLINLGYVEVETPMMQIIPGGATARPFITHHNALDMELYLRIAPELYLKRLVVGGFERVFEINRNFRNEGLSTRHNPEFTMLEFYQAYADYRDAMNITEDMLRKLAHDILGNYSFNYQNQPIDFAKPFARMTIKQSILHFNPEIKETTLDDIQQAKQLAESIGIPLHDNYGLGRIQFELFERLAEPKLIEPTFITEFPIEVSPLARKNSNNEFIADRFELFIGGRELANGFSELNDPEDQTHRFNQQVKSREAGDVEAMFFDHDYITALEYGMPPTAGVGIGIDRLAMLFTDSPSIRDVILFPLMRPQDQSRES